MENFQDYNIGKHLLTYSYGAEYFYCKQCKLWANEIYSEDCASVEEDEDGEPDNNSSTGT